MATKYIPTTNIKKGMYEINNGISRISVVVHKDSMLGSDRELAPLLAGLKASWLQVLSHMDERYAWEQTPDA